MKWFIGVIIALVLIAAYGIGQADYISKRIESYAETKLQEPKIEDAAIFNINYTYWTAKYDRCLELIEKYKEKDAYATSKNLEFVKFMEAKCYDKKLDNRRAYDLYKAYLSDYPEGKYAKDATWRVTDLQSGTN